MGVLGEKLGHLRGDRSKSVFFKNEAIPYWGLLTSVHVCKFKHILCVYIDIN